MNVTPHSTSQLHVHVIKIFDAEIKLIFPM